MTLTARLGLPDIARCDGCGVEAAAVEDRDRHGQRLRAWLPEGWRLIDEAHLCAACLAANPDLFADRREAFEARIEQLGVGLVVDIAASLSLPVELARGWAADWLAADKGRSPI